MMSWAVAAPAAAIPTPSPCCVSRRIRANVPTRSFVSGANNNLLPRRALLTKLLAPYFFSPPSVRCSSYSEAAAGAGDDNFDGESCSQLPLDESSAQMSAKLAKLGLAAVLAYGLFDGVTYTSFFVLAFLGYEKSTGKNPAANLQALIGIVLLMWTGNNVTRPFRVAGAAALAPVIDKGLRRIQTYFSFSKLVYAFALVVAIMAGSCLTVIGLLILSRWGK